MKGDIEIYDQTGREGPQQSGIVFTLAQKIEIADATLNKYKVAKCFEVACYPYTLEEAKEMVKRFGKDKIMLHHRLYEKDIDNSKTCGKNVQAGVFIGTSDSHLRSSNLTRKSVLKRVEDVLEYAHQSRVRIGKLTFEDAPATDLGLLKDLIKIAEKYEVEAISPAQTVERYRYNVYGKLMRDLMKVTDIPLVTHCHNDRDLSVPASLEAYDAGVRKFGATWLGIGEGAGVAPIELLLFNFKMMSLNVNTECITPMCDLVKRHAGISISPHAPLGEYCTPNAGVVAPGSAWRVGSRYPFLLVRQT